MQTRDRKENPRRQFLKLSAMGVIGAVTSPALLTPASQIESSKEKEAMAISPPHRIKELSLRTASPLADMAAFYKDVLEMNVQLTEEKLVVDGGATKITFTPAANSMKPYYHFAFNIPENKILSARNWLGERTKLSITPPNSRAKGYPNEVMPFNFWNSHSIYFWDPAGNILELICRHDLKNGTKGEFRSDEILYASEIGFVTDGSVNELAGEIKSTFQLSQYRTGGDGFRAIGDETGLLILFKRGGTPIGALDGQTWQTFPTDVTIEPEVKLKSATLPFSIKTM